MKQLSKYLLAFAIGVGITFLFKGDRIIESGRVDTLKKIIAKQDSILAEQRITIDTLRKTRAIVIVKRDGTRVNINNKINYIDSLTKPVVTDSMVNTALLWAKQQSDSL